MNDDLIACPLDSNPVQDAPTTRCAGARSEREFYQGYAWCLNAYPTVQAAVGYLRVELAKPDHDLDAWQRGEVLTNIYLLSCGILSTLEDFLQNTKYCLPWGLAALPFSRVFLKVVQTTADWRWARRCKQVRQWKFMWEQALAEFLAHLVAESPSAGKLAACGRRLAELLPPLLPRALQ